jgi:phosphoglycerol transferase MdoB-like AlkP superfamily enzyme
VRPLAHRAVRPLALGGTLALAKGLAITGSSVPASVWTAPAFLWHDVAVAAAFWLVDRLTRQSRWMWAPYFAIVLLAAIDVPITRALSSPLTVPMLRAAGGPLIDSILHYVTAANVLRMAIVIGAAAVLPFALARTPVFARRAIVAASVVIAIAGPSAVSRVETRGLHRNAVTAILTTAVPRIAARHATGDWRASPFEQVVSEDLTNLRGASTDQNVILIALESTGAGYLAPYGAMDDPMPTLSRLAGRSIVFEHAYAVYPESIKGLFSVLCSRDPAFDAPAEAHAGAPCAWLARTLGDAGYRSALFHSGRFAYLGMQALVDRSGFDVREDAGAIGGNVESSFGVDEPAAVRRMLSWIDGLDSGQRFFLTYLPIAGHHPYATTAPGPFSESSELGAYKNALHEADAALASLLDGLRDRGLDRNTLVVLYGDHGEAFGQHEGNFGHSLFLYEENVRVPLIIAGASESIPPLRVGRVASVLDIAPTIVDLLGLPSEPHHQGVSLLEPRERMALFYTDYSLGLLGLRDGCWKNVFELDSGRSQLFDLCRDPDERRNLSTEAPNRIAAYRDRLQRWIEARRAEIVGGAVFTPPEGHAPDRRARRAARVPG